MKYTQENVLIILGIIVISFLVGRYLHRLRGVNCIDTVCPTCKDYEWSNFDRKISLKPGANASMEGGPACWKKYNISATCAKCPK